MRRTSTRILLAMAMGLGVVAFGMSLARSEPRPEHVLTSVGVGGPMLGMLFYSMLTWYASPVTPVVFDEEGVPQRAWEDLARARSNLGVIFLWGGLGLYLLLMYGLETWLAGLMLPFILLGFHWTHSNMCPFCRKINIFTTHQCVNCWRGLELFDKR